MAGWSKETPQLDWLGGGLRPFQDQAVSLSPEASVPVSAEIAKQGLGWDPKNDYQRPSGDGFTPAGGAGAPSIGGQPGSISGGRSDAQNAAMPGASGDESSGGIGLQGTLGILNLGAGIGSQIYKMATKKKPKRPQQRIGWGNVSF